MKLVKRLSEIWENVDYPFLIHTEGTLHFSEIKKQNPINLDDVRQGDVVALIGDFEPESILTLLRLIDLDVILVPLTDATRSQHEYFFTEALVDVVIDKGQVRRIEHDKSHEFIEELRAQNHAGLVLFSTGTTGAPKAILHDFTVFLKRFGTPRPTLRAINFLLFDHIGGINTLFHTLFNKGTVIAPTSRLVEDILDMCAKHAVDVLPTTPTFLRMMLMSGLVPEKIPPSLKIITYGTERMDQTTLSELCRLLPDVDFRQTFGMSELGIVRVKSEARDSLFMKIGGKGVETKVIDNVLYIRSETRMLGYINAPSPFDTEGWYNTKDVVEQRDDMFRVVGRTTEVINVGGLKFMASDVEKVALAHDGVSLAKAVAKENPITGQHVELNVSPKQGQEIDKKAFKHYLQENLQSHMVPRRIRITEIKIGHRFKLV